MNSIECFNLSKTYRGKGESKEALKNVSFSINSNGVFAIIGKNGAGKTTLVRILATQLMPSSGTAKINGLDIITDEKKIRSQIAILPQEAKPVPWMNPRQNIFSYMLWRGFTPKEAIARADKAIKYMHLEKVAKEKNESLSGGMKRKVLLATVLASEAEIIFLDEPTIGLDPISRVEIWNIIKKLKKDHLILLTTHYLEEAEELADKIAILNNGRLVAMGTLEELRHKIPYQYSIMTYTKNIKKIRASLSGCKVVKGKEKTQILANKEIANRITTLLVKKNMVFSRSPVSLYDIFYYFARTEIGENDEEE